MSLASEVVPPDQRLEGDELLDHPDADPATVRESLRHIARANRWFGGWWVVRRGLARLLAGVPRGQRLSLLDVGTGAGDLPLAAARWAAAEGWSLTPLGIERHPTAAAVARGSGVPTTLASAFQLPLADRSVDLVLASQVAHHFSARDTVALFRELDRVARHGVLVADLRRSPWALAGFWCGSRLFGFDAATRADGLTSVRRGFSVAELESLCVRAGVSARVERTPLFRLLATWRRADR